MTPDSIIQNRRAGHDVRTVTQHASTLRFALCLMVMLLGALPTFASDLAGGATLVADASSESSDTKPLSQVQCLPAGDGYLRAKLSGAIIQELNWHNNDMNCAGSVRPDDTGLRLRFSHADKGNGAALVLLFGISGLHEGQSGKALAVNVTIIREGSGEFYGTQGDNKCTVDEIRQQAIEGMPLRKRAYRVEARGFCTQPARALNGNGAVLITRFDFAGRVDFTSEDDPPTQPKAVI